MQRCWATPTNNADYDTNFELISDGCGTEQALSQGKQQVLHVTISRDAPNKVIQMFHNCLESFDGELDEQNRPIFTKI